MTCPKCKETINTVVRESITSWMCSSRLSLMDSLPFTVGLFTVSILTLVVLGVNTTFEIAFCIGGVTVVGIVYLMSFILNGKTWVQVSPVNRSRHFCPKCNAFIGLEKELISSS